MVFESVKAYVAILCVLNCVVRRFYSREFFVRLAAKIVLLLVVFAGIAFIAPDLG